MRLCAAAVALLAGATLLWARRRLTRYEVGGRSMVPALRPGEYVVALRLGAGAGIRPGDVVLATDPRQPARVLVKRVAAVGGPGIELLGDNPAESTDSREFGHIPRDDVVGRVLAVYWPLRAARIVR